VLLLPGAAFLIGVLWAAVIPLWEIPDEPAHYGYVQTLGEHGVSSGPPYISREIQAANHLAGVDVVSQTGYVKQNFAPNSTNGPTEPRIRALPQTLRDSATGETDNPAGSYPPGYYVLASLPYRALASGDVLTMAFGLRLFSAFITSITVLFHYLTLRRFFDDRETAKATTLLIVLAPMYVFLGMAVNVDVLVWLLFSVFLFLITGALTRGLTPGLNLGLAILVSAGLWIKQTFALGLVVYVLLLAFLIMRHRVTWRAVAQFSVVFAGVLLLIDGWLYLSGTIDTTISDPGGAVRDLGLAGFITHLARRLPTYRWVFTETFWGEFGWLDTRLSDLLYAAIGYIVVAAVAGVAAYVAWSMWRRRPDPRVLFFILIVLLFAGTFLMLNYLRVAAGEDWFLQGRYLFPVMAPIMALLVTGITWFAGRMKRAILAALVVAMLCFHTAVLVGHVIPRYYV
jgi:4-amino-4-deoxy-L-arabinose transferase-like glycosyltransferase